MRNSLGNIFLKYILLRYFHLIFRQLLARNFEEQVPKDHLHGCHPSQFNSLNCLPLPFIENFNNWFVFSSPLVTYNNKTQKAFETRAKKTRSVIGGQKMTLHSAFRTALLCVPLENGTPSGENCLPRLLVDPPHFPPLSHPCTRRTLEKIA